MRIVSYGGAWYTEFNGTMNSSVTACKVQSAAVMSTIAKQHCNLKLVRAAVDAGCHSIVVAIGYLALVTAFGILNTMVVEMAMKVSE